MGGVLPDPFAVLAGARDTGSHGRLLSGRLQRPLPLPASLTRLLEVETDEIDEPFELGRRSSESDDYYYLLTLTDSPTGHRLTALYATPDEHGHQSGGRTPLKFN